jgi:uncharacterized damage-inducible protein DinB
MIHPLVEQLRFAQSELGRALEGISEEDAARRLVPMNCISWSIGHLAWQEQRNWLFRGQGRLLLPEVQERFASGGPASTPSLAEVWEAWRAITAAADPWLDALTSAELAEPRPFGGGREGHYTFGTLLLRTTYHYWYHTGENLAIRQLLGHRGLPEFVGNIDAEAPYRPE